MQDEETPVLRGIWHPRPSRSRKETLNLETAVLVRRTNEIEVSVERLLASIVARRRSKRV